MTPAGDPDVDAPDEGPVWLVRAALLLLFLAFAAFLARELATILQHFS